ncbi:MAG: alkaline phosphatase family protein [Verrucomicrobiae bacterium]|nr:alkaline phosphatase family protein [Verrucomicrobiae bacterium]
MFRQRELIASAPLGALALVSSLFLWSTREGDSADPSPEAEKKRCVLIIGIDGLRADALRAAQTPNLDALGEGGAVTYNAFAGGVIGTPTQQITSSGPGWSSILTGVWTNKHRVIDNSFANNRLAQFPHFFKFIKLARPHAVVASFIDWEEIDTKIVEPAGDYFDHRFPDGQLLPGGYPERDRLVLSKVEEYVAGNSPDAMFVYFGNVDIAGHSSGFTPANPAYISAIETVDVQVGKVLEAIRDRPEYAAEEWMTIVATDHGGSGTGHGGQSLSERTIFLIANGDGVMPRVHAVGPGHTAVPPTAMRHLGIPVDPTWGWEAEAFGYPPYVTANLRAVADQRFGQVALSWAPAEGYELASLELLRDGELIAMLSPTANEFVDTPPILNQGGKEQEFTYTLRVTGADADKIDPLTVRAAFYDGPIGSRRIVELPCNGDLVDMSGNLVAPDAETLLFSRDNYREYLEVRTGDEVSFGRPEKLKFGSSIDFSVSFLVKMAATTGSFGTMIGNRALAGGQTRGWAIGTTRDGQLRWEFADARSGVQAQVLAPTLADGRWHHVTVTHDRNGDAVLYLEGVEIEREDISAIGTVDTSSDVRMGGRFAGGIDDVQLWDRRLLPGEVRSLAIAADLSHPPAHDAIVDLRFDTDFGDASIAGAVKLDAAGVRGNSAQMVNDGSGVPAYLSLREDPGLSFGAKQDFSISVWVKSDGAFGLGGTKGDPAILSNKNWRFGAGKGWAIAAGQDGRWQWNIGDGDNSHRSDYDGPAGEISDGEWHQIAVSHDRDAAAVLYFDGREVARRDISELEDINSDLPIAIGTDGQFGADWPAWFNGSIDNVQIWRRTLSSPEVAFLFEHFTSTADASSTAMLDIKINGNYALLSYPQSSNGYGQPGIDYTAGGRRYSVERSGSLTQESWQVLSPGAFEMETAPVIISDSQERVTLRILRGQADYFRLQTAVE